MTFTTPETSPNFRICSLMCIQITWIPYICFLWNPSDMFEFHLSSLGCEKNCDCFQSNFQGIFSKMVRVCRFWLPAGISSWNYIWDYVKIGNGQCGNANGAVKYAQFSSNDVSLCAQACNDVTFRLIQLIVVLNLWGIELSGLYVVLELLVFSSPKR